MHIKSGEVGHTLTETLAMLAIVGILSVVGMRGYTSAMDKLKANALIQEAQKRAIIVADQIGFNNQTPSLAEFSPYNTTSSGTFGEVITKGLSGQFGIQVSNVNKSICQKILNTIGDKTPICRLSHETTPTTPITSCDEDNAFLFIYNNDMTGENDTQYCESDESCGACGVCNSTTHLCEGECTPPENECDDDADCNAENECMICDTQTHKCKDGCERVEYLENKGRTQTIDTGFIANSGSKIQATITPLETRRDSWMISSFEANARRYVAYQYPQDKWGGGYGNYFSGTYNMTIGKTVELVCEFDEKQIITIDGNEAVNITNSNPTVSTSASIRLFGHSASSTWCRIGKTKMWNNGKLVRDFVPVIAPNGKACMFNKEKEDGKLKLYCDANGGTFKTNKDE